MAVCPPPDAEGVGIGHGGKPVSRVVLEQAVHLVTHEPDAMLRRQAHQLSLARGQKSKQRTELTITLSGSSLLIHSTEARLGPFD